MHAMHGRALAPQASDRSRAGSNSKRGTRQLRPPKQKNLMDFTYTILDSHKMTMLSRGVRFERARGMKQAWDQQNPLGHTIRRAADAITGRTRQQEPFENINM